MADQASTSAQTRTGIVMLSAPASRVRVSKLATVLAGIGLPLAAPDTEPTAADIVVVCWTPAACALDDITFAAMQARNRNALIEVMLAPCRPPRPFGASWNTAQLSAWTGDAADAHLVALVEIARAKLEGRRPRGHVLAARLMRWGGGGAIAMGALVATMNFGALKQVYDGFLNPAASEKALIVTDAKVDAVLAMLKQGSGDKASSAQDEAARASITRLLSNPKAVSEKAIKLIEKGDLDGALRELRQAADKGEQEVADLAQLWSSIGALTSYRNPGEAMSAYERALQLAPEDTAGLLQLADLYRRDGRLDDAQNLLGRSIDAMAGANGPASEVGDVYSAQAAISRTLGHYEDARAELEEAIRIHREAGEIGIEAVELAELADLLEVMGEREQPAALYERAIQLEEEMADKDQVAMLLRDRGELARLRGRLDEAIQLHTQAVEAAEKRKDDYDLAIALLGLGDAYKDARRWSDAARTHLKARGYFEKAGDKFSQADCLRFAAESVAATGDLATAARHARNARELYKRAGALHDATRVEAWLKAKGQKLAGPT